MGRPRKSDAKEAVPDFKKIGEELSKEKTSKPRGRPAVPAQPVKVAIGLAPEPPYKDSGDADDADVKRGRKTLNARPIAERFDELLGLLRVFLRANHECVLQGLRLIEVPGTGGKEWRIVGKKDGDTWATLRRRRGWHTVNKGSLLAALRRDEKLKKFFGK